MNRTRRVKRVVLTDAGQALLTEAVQHWDAAQQTIEASLRGSDLGSLHAALEAIAQS